MVKKATLILIICMLLISACVFVSCKEEAVTPPAGGGSEASEDYTDPEGKNLIDGDFELGDEGDIIADGSELSVVDKAGLKGSKALFVEQTANYGQIYVDITEFYGAGKDYYVAASFKNNGSTNKKDLTAYLSYTVVPGWVVEACEAAIEAGGTEEGDMIYDYEYDEIYGGGFYSDEDALELYGITTTSEGLSINDSSYVRVSAIIPSEEIEEIVAGTKLAKLYLTIMVGTYPNQGGYNYYLDDVVVKDLDTENLPLGPFYPIEEE